MTATERPTSEYRWIRKVTLMRHVSRGLELGVFDDGKLMYEGAPVLQRQWIVDDYEKMIHLLEWRDVETVLEDLPSAQQRCAVLNTKSAPKEPEKKP